MKFGDDTQICLGLPLSLSSVMCYCPLLSLGRCAGMVHSNCSLLTRIIGDHRRPIICHSHQCHLTTGKDQTQLFTTSSHLSTVNCR